MTADLKDKVAFCVGIGGRVGGLVSWWQSQEVGEGDQSSGAQEGVRSLRRPTEGCSVSSAGSPGKSGQQSPAGFETTSGKELLEIIHSPAVPTSHRPPHFLVHSMDSEPQFHPQ